MITIRELSENIGISKVGITKWIERNGYKERLQKTGNKYLIPEDIEQAIRANFALRESKEDKAVHSTDEPQGDITSEIIALLREQLESKDREIERLHLQVENLQMINADMVKVVRELNTIQAMQLTDGSEQQSGREAVEDQERTSEEQRKKEDPTTSEQRKISFWERLKRSFNL